MEFGSCLPEFFQSEGRAENPDLTSLLPDQSRLRLGNPIRRNSGHAREFKPERATDAGSGFDANGSAKALNGLGDDGEAYASAALGFGCRHAFEDFENLLMIFGSDPNA